MGPAAQELPALLAAWDQAVVASIEPEDDRHAELTAAGTVLRAPAAEAAVAALEDRLGRSLPPSYRAFLLRSDGADAQPAWGLAEPHGLLPCAEVGWYRDLGRSDIDGWTQEPLGGDDHPTRHPAFTVFLDPPEADYVDHPPGDDTVKIGHVLHALQVSLDHDGVILLNPLVVDQHGEWEAWDLSAKNPGVLRHRSFAALLAEDAERTAGHGPPGWVDPERIREMAEQAHDAGREDAERLHACRWLEDLAPETSVDDVVRDLLAPGRARAVRRGAVELLARRETTESRAQLAAHADDPDAELAAFVRDVLAHGAEAAFRRADLRRLVDPDATDQLIRGELDADLLWEAWQQTGDPRLIAQLAYRSDPRAAAPLAELVVDPRVPDDVRLSLVTHASWPGDRSVIPALLQVADRELADPHWVAHELERLGATVDAVALYARSVRGDGRYGQSAQALGWIEDPAAGAALLGLLAEVPSAELAVALGWHPGPEAAGALLALATQDPDLHVPALDGLERMAGPEALDALAALTDGGDVLAARALARRGDLRALEPLLDLLESADPHAAIAGADGLRDLRSRDAAVLLLRAVLRTEDPELATIATHALVGLGVPEAAHALEHLAAGDDPGLRRVAALWR